ncbi:MAG: ATP-binding protein [Planctomycetota bacterium]
MSYRTFKRVLGETNLERKCRRFFGICMLVLVTGSFWWYGQETDQIVYKMNRFVGKALVNSAMLEAHKSVLYPETLKNQEAWETNEKLTKLFRTRDFEWVVLHPPNSGEFGKPSNNFEWALMDEWSRVGEDLASDEAIDEAFQQDEDGDLLGRDGPSDDGSVYYYYQPLFAKQECVVCHRVPFDRIPYTPDLQVGDLLSIVRVEMKSDTQKAQADNRSLLITLGVVTVSLAMAALYVIVRYIIVKPLAHLRDVSNAVRRGDVEQRAVIHTGDEFEEVGAAFNRMLRQLLRQQDELRNINSELDAKIDELAQANMRLFEMNQLKSDFLATVSHELRTPLNSIIGFSDLLSNVQALNDKQRRYAGNIERSGKQLLHMINDILDLAKIESGRMELRLSEFDIGAVVLTQCDLARPLSEKKKIELDCEIAPGLPPMRQDQGKIEQILNNLLSNAIKFTPDGGRIHVTARRDRREDLRLIVSDTGVGISESDQVQIFEKFRQGGAVMIGGNAMTREYSGTGLGLSIVRELCRLLGGDVTIESELRSGSEFTVLLPWTIAAPTRIESPIAEELRELTRPRPDLPLNSPLAAAAGDERAAH